MTSNVTTKILKRVSNIEYSSNDVFVKYDFENLYLSLYLEPTCLAFYRFLLENVPNAHLITPLLRELTHLICYNLYFTFRGRIFEQMKGVPIGSPIAGILAEIVLRSIGAKCTNFNQT